MTAFGGQLLGGDEAEKIQDEDDERHFKGDAEAQQHLNLEIDERFCRPSRAPAEPVAVSEKELKRGFENEGVAEGDADDKEHRARREDRREKPLFARRERCLLYTSRCV